MEKRDQILSEEGRLLESEFKITQALVECIERDHLERAKELLKEREQVLKRLLELKGDDKLVLLVKEKLGEKSLRARMMRTAFDQVNANVLKVLQRKKRDVLGRLEEIQKERQLLAYRQ